MIRRLSLALLVLCLTSAAGYSEEDYSRIARLSYIDGNVSFQHTGDVDWSAASANMALQPADRVYTGTDGRAEIEFDDGSILRLAEKTDVEILSMGDNLIQLRLLVGLTTLNVQSGLDFEINTPAAAFSTAKKGIYRFDVADNGDSDGIVRKGALDAASNNFTRRAESGELIHATPGDQGTNVLSRYDGRDEWDEWNDRRNAEIKAYQSRQYLPDHVSMGVRDLDTYGHWVDVEYGSAWVPYQVGAGWSPYWEGRWVYRPLWGWTWVSYEPWGWLPYHYGRWYRDSSFGWCWLPGASFGFNFWSPGLVRFYNGPSWVSWVPLGPGDYYNVNNFYYHRNYAYQLNNLRMLQRRSPDDLFNRHIPGAFRTTQTDHFLNSSFGSRARIVPVAGVDEPWRNGRMVTDRLGIAPGARSYSPMPDRPVVRPTIETRPVVVRTEPALRTGPSDRFLRIATPNPGSSMDSRTGGRTGRDAVTPGTSSPRILTSPGSTPRDGSGSGIGGTQNTPGSAPRIIEPGSRNPRSEGTRSFGREVPGDSTRQPGSSMRRMESSPQSPGTTDGNANRGRREMTSPGSTTRPETPQRRMESTPAPAPRYDRAPPVQERRQPERPQQDRQKPSADLGSSFNYTPRGYSRPEYRIYETSPANSVQRFPQGNGGQTSGQSYRDYSPRQYSAPAWTRDSSGSAPSWNRGNSGGWGSSSAPTVVTPSRERAPSWNGDASRSWGSSAPTVVAPSPQRAPSWNSGGGSRSWGSSAPGMTSPQRQSSPGWSGSGGGMRSGGTFSAPSSGRGGPGGMGQRRER
jgi:hypothetical protein